MFRAKRILALDVGASRLVLGEFAAVGSGGLELTQSAVALLGVDPDSDADLPAHTVHAIRQVMREKNIRPGPVVVSISGQIVFPRYVRLPPVSRDKIAQIVRYEAQQNVPFPMNEVVWDHQLIHNEDGGLSAMLMAVKTESVRKIMTCIEAAGLDPDIVDVSPMALYNAVRYNYPDLPGCTMILDVGARTSNVIFAEGTRIFMRSIPVAGNAITRELMKEFDLPFNDAEQLKLSHVFVGFGGPYEGPDSSVSNRVSKIARNVMTRLHAELSRTINFYRSQQGGSQPSLILLAGGSSVIPHTDTFLKDKLKVDVDYLNPFRNVTVSSAVTSEHIGRHMQVLGEVVGLALRRVLTCPVEINLLPPELVSRKAFQARLPFLGLAAGALVCLMLVSGAFLHRLRITTHERLDAVRERVEELGAVAHKLDGIQNQERLVVAKTGELRDLISIRSRWLEILNQIHALMPDGMWLVAIKAGDAGGAGEGGSIEMRGMAFADKVKHENISEFVASLKKLPGFSDKVEIRRIRPVQGTDYVNEFVIEVALKRSPNG
jgi:type IV pilus assembly protein PilM